MLQDRLKTLWHRLTTKKLKPPLFPPSELAEELRMREPMPDELALGIASFDSVEEGKIIHLAGTPNPRQLFSACYLVNHYGKNKYRLCRR